MIVRVQHQGKAYYSYVFAHFEIDYMPQYIVYDMEEKMFKVVEYFTKSCNGNRQIGFINESEKDYIFQKELNLNIGIVRKCAGYSWLIENVSLINNIIEKKPINEKYKAIATELNLTIDPDAWNEVITQEDAEDMMNHVGCFHDWYLLKMEAVSNPYSCEEEAKLQLRFTSQGAFDALVEFEQGITINYSFCNANRIYLSSIVFNDGHIYWLNGDEELTEEDINSFDYIQANKLRWKFVLKENHNW